ncbi:MAG: hypothetical protein ACP5I8_12225 [Phycisphaerae bacterium]
MAYPQFPGGWPPGITNTRTIEAVVSLKRTLAKSRASILSVTASATGRMKSIMGGPEIIATSATKNAIAGAVAKQTTAVPHSKDILTLLLLPTGKMDTTTSPRPANATHEFTVIIRFLQNHRRLDQP